MLGQNNIHKRAILPEVWKANGQGLQVLLVLQEKGFLFCQSMGSGKVQWSIKRADSSIQVQGQGISI